MWWFAQTLAMLGFIALSLFAALGVFIGVSISFGEATSARGQPVRVAWSRGERWVFGLAWLALFILLLALGPNRHPLWFVVFWSFPVCVFVLRLLVVVWGRIARSAPAIGRSTHSVATPPRRADRTPRAG